MHVICKMSKQASMLQFLGAGSGGPRTFRQKPLANGPSSSVPADKPKSNAKPTMKAVQMHLDLGQKDFALVRCPRCGMVYAPGDPGDEALHRAQHDAADAALRFAGWANERVVLDQGPSVGRLLLVQPSDPAPHIKKVIELCEYLEQAMGLETGWVLGGSWGGNSSSRAKGSGGSRGSGGSVGAAKGSEHRVSGGSMTAAAENGIKGRAKGSGAQYGQPAEQHAANSSGSAATPGTQRVFLFVGPGKTVAGCLVAERVTHATRAAAHAAHAPFAAASFLRVEKGGSSGRGVGAESGAGSGQAPPSVVTTSSPSPATSQPSRGATSAERAAKRARTDGNAAPAVAAVAPAVAAAGEEGEGTGQSAPATGSQGSNLGAEGRANTTNGQEQQDGQGEGTGGSGEIVGHASCSRRCVPAMMGVRVIWVAPAVRRQRLATRMLDVARCHLVAGYVVPRAQVAFASGPLLGADATAFAAVYAGADGVLDYE